MADLGLILDLSNMAEQSFLQAVDRYPGVIIASHANARALVRNSPKPDRHLSDRMIRRLAEREGVIGVVPYNRFLRGDWTPAEGKAAVPLEAVLAQIDYICQLTGSAAHAGIGSDFDGGFGVEAVPAEIDTVADLAKLADGLRARGYADPDVEAIMGGNWLSLLRRGLPE
jgi:membrane dipeptidase